MGSICSELSSGRLVSCLERQHVCLGSPAFYLDWPYLSTAALSSFSLLIKIHFWLDIFFFPSHECPERMLLCAAFYLLASPPPPTPLPSSYLLLMGLKVLDLMLVVVNFWFQHIFFVFVLTSQLPLSPPTGTCLRVLFLGLVL